MPKAPQSWTRRGASEALNPTFSDTLRELANKILNKQNKILKLILIGCNLMTPDEILKIEKQYSYGIEDLFHRRLSYKLGTINI